MSTQMEDRIDKQASRNVEEEGDSHRSATCSISDGDVSLGSRFHDSGRCKPCVFHHTKGCNSGRSCTFCHRCPPYEKQRRKRVGRNIFQKIQRGGSIPDGLDGSFGGSSSGGYSPQSTAAGSYACSTSTAHSRQSSSSTARAYPRFGPASSHSRQNSTSSFGVSSACSDSDQSFAPGGDNLCNRANCEQAVFAGHPQLPTQRQGGATQNQTPMAPVACFVQPHSVDGQLPYAGGPIGVATQAPADGTGAAGLHRQQQFASQVQNTMYPPRQAIASPVQHTMYPAMQAVPMVVGLPTQAPYAQTQQGFVQVPVQIMAMPLPQQHQQNHSFTAVGAGVPVACPINPIMPAAPVPIYLAPEVCTPVEGSRASYMATQGLPPVPEGDLYANDEPGSPPALSRSTSGTSSCSSTAS